MTSSPCTRSDGDPRALPGFRRTYAPGRLTLGLGFPMRSRTDSDDVHDPAAQVRLARAAEAGGFAALYVRDIPLRVPSFGDVGQVYDPWVFLTHMAAHTSRIALGTAGIVLPVRHPLQVRLQPRPDLRGAVPAGPGVGRQARGVPGVRPRAG